jgi:hypothetical protein
MDRKNHVSSGRYQPVTFAPCLIGPCRVMRHKVYGNGRRHLQIDQRDCARIDRFP